MKVWKSSPVAGAIAVAGALAMALAAQSSVAAETTAAPSDPYQGWGIAISYMVIGELCPGAMSSDDVEVVKRFVAAGKAHSEATDKGVFDEDRFVREFRAAMVAKYTDQRNCAVAEIEEARKAITLLRAREASAGK
jgi:hypothetical protein